MSGQNADDKAGAPGINQDGLGASSSTDSPHFSRDDQNIIDTVDVRDGGKGAEGADTDPDKKGKDGDSKDGDDRFDQHPRFKELNERMKAAEERAIRAEAKLEVLDKGDGKGEQDAGEQGWKPIFTYEDITKFSDDQIREQMEDKPKEFLTNFFAQAVDETAKVIVSMLNQRDQAQAKEATLSDFAKSHPGDPEHGIKGFEDMKKSGEIKDYMKANPGHTVKSAYLEMTLPAREKAIAARTEAKIKADQEKAAEEARKNKEAKAGARVLGQGPAGAPKGDTGVELKDTKARGGLVNVLAQKIEAMRSQR